MFLNRKSVYSNVPYLSKDIVGSCVGKPFPPHRNSAEGNLAIATKLHL